MSILWGALQVALLGAAALGYGAMAGSRLETRESLRERLVSRLALGLGVVIMLTTAAGWLRIWGSWFHHGLLAGGLLLLAFKQGRTAGQSRPRIHRWNLLWAGPALTVLLFYTAFPPTFYDALLYHLGVPGYYLQAGSFAPWPENLFSALPQNAEMLNLLLLSGGSVHGSKFLSLAVSILILIYLADWGRETGLRRFSLPAWIFFSIPEIIFLSATEKNDLLLMLFLLIAVRRLTALKADPGSRRVCLSAGVFLGLACGVKWQGLLYGAAFVAAYVLAHGGQLGKRLRHAAAIGFIVVLAISPWLIRNQIEFGNPVHPYLSGLFSAGGEASGQARQIHEGVRRGQGFTPRAILSFFLRMFLSPYSLGLTHITGILLLLLLPLLLFKGRLKERGFLLAGCSIGFVLLLAASRVPRYFLPIFMVLSLPLAAGWEKMEEKLPRYRRLANLLLFSLVTVQAIQGVSLLERMTLGGRYVTRKWLGTLPAGAHYLDIIPYYPAASFINRTLPAGSRVAFLGEERTFYVQRPFLCASLFDTNPTLSDFLAAADASAWASALRRRTITHVLYCPAGLKRIEKNLIGHCQESDWVRLELYLSLWPQMYSDDRYFLYAVPQS